MDLRDLPAQQWIDWSKIDRSKRPANRAAKISKGKRRRVYERDGNQCVRCTSTDDLTLDHIVPRSRGGRNDDNNLQTLCRSCNSSKGTRD